MPKARQQQSSAASELGNGSRPPFGPTETEIEQPRVSSASDVFADLDALRLDNPGSLTSTSEVLAHVPVRKPDKTAFFRVHPDRTMSLAASVFDDREERETYFVVPAIRPLLVGFLKPVLLSTCMTRQGTLFLWPVTLPSDDRHGSTRAWGETGRACADLAKTCWVSLRSDMQMGAYRIIKAEGALPDPVWPALSLSEILAIAFKGRIIDHSEHPVIRRLRGLV